MVPVQVQVVDDVVENSNKSSSNLIFVPYKVHHCFQALKQDKNMNVPKKCAEFIFNNFPM